mmetsp:Transcript_29473/g.72985  ORF Transcript_29473/g.72985 Transcript_29473/m.72985 type:complete len:214 (-) Transcript_29473:627-1268(-)
MPPGGRRGRVNHLHRVPSTVHTRGESGGVTFQATPETCLEHSGESVVLVGCYMRYTGCYTCGSEGYSMSKESEKETFLEHSGESGYLAQLEQAAHLAHHHVLEFVALRVHLCLVPHIQAPQCAVGRPPLRDCIHLRDAGQVGQAVEGRHPLAQALVIMRHHVRAVEVEHLKVLHGPLPDAAQGQQRIAHLRLAHALQGVVRQRVGLAGPKCHG